MIWVSFGSAPVERYAFAWASVMLCRRLYTVPPHFFFSSRYTVDSLPGVP